MFSTDRWMSDVAAATQVRTRGRDMVRRPPTDTAFPPILVNAEHGNVASVPGFPVGTLLTDNAADGDFGAVIRVSLGNERPGNVRAEMR